MKEFIKTFALDETNNGLFDENMTFKEFEHLCKGKSFNNGLYRILDDEERTEAKTILKEISNHQIEDNINIFGRDWLGRYFAQQSPNETLLFDIIDGQVYKAAGDIDFLHDIVLVEDEQALLERELFDEWSKEKGNIVNRTHVAVIIHPLFFGGTLEAENLEIGDNKFNWEFTLELLNYQM